MAGRKVEYANYLKSAKWRELRARARERAGNRCEMCGGYADAVHHVRYPKRFEDDHIDNLIVVCDYHHDLVHGKRLERLMRNDLQIFTYSDGCYDSKLRTSMHNGKQIFHFEDAYYGLGNTRSYEMAYDNNARIKRPNHGMENLMTKMWVSILPEFKLSLNVEQPDGIERPERWLYEPGLYAMMGQLHTEQARRWQKWVYGEVIPQIRQTGGYRQGLADASVTGAMAQVGHQLIAMAGELEKKVDKAEFYEKIAEMSEASAKHARQEAATARQWIAMTGVADPTTENAQKLGKEARAVCNERGIRTVSKGMEGTYRVWFWPVAALEIACRRLGWTK